MKQVYLVARSLSGFFSKLKFIKDWGGGEIFPFFFSPNVFLVTIGMPDTRKSGLWAGSLEEANRLSLSEHRGWYWVWCRR